MITDDEALAALCHRMQQTDAIALDTEFVRTRTFYPLLGLIQIYDGEQLALIDPLQITAWEPFCSLLSNPAIIKYLHAASEDLDVFIHHFNQVPANLMDTQLLAAFTGSPLSCGFSTLVQNLEGVALDKSEARTDWLARPLTGQQCQYAAADVFYLLPVARKLKTAAMADGRWRMAEQESELLCQRRQVVPAAEEVWRDISHASQLRPRQLAALQRLAKWRLETAREKNSAINFVIREELLWKIARYLPGSLAELGQLGLGGQEIRLYGNALLSCVEQAVALDESALPPSLLTLADKTGYKNAFKLLKTEICHVATDANILPELLASRRQINQLLNWHWQLKPGNEMPELLTQWRGELLREKITPRLAEL